MNTLARYVRTANPAKRAWNVIAFWAAVVTGLSLYGIWIVTIIKYGA